MDQINEDTFIEIAKNLSLYDLRHMCNSSSKYYRACQNPEFWRKLITVTFGQSFPAVDPRNTYFVSKIKNIPLTEMNFLARNDQEIVGYRYTKNGGFNSYVWIRLEDIGHIASQSEQMNEDEEDGVLSFDRKDSILFVPWFDEINLKHFSYQERIEIIPFKYVKDNIARYTDEFVVVTSYFRDDYDLDSPIISIIKYDVFIEYIKDKNYNIASTTDYVIITTSTREYMIDFDDYTVINGRLRT